MSSRKSSLTFAVVRARPECQEFKSVLVCDGLVFDTADMWSVRDEEIHQVPIDSTIKLIGMEFTPLINTYVRIRRKFKDLNCENIGGTCWP
ncbi:hypothetical protein AVEN_62485-1 [Araneus ventricosus]|uniref:Uncharacterized protein n=1 Tax=Araneus ventricosus TaxID=182803 RepID=A0A4Y2L971_ARAVE|nr:hypothetical protein AVEN_62485-1 [Araneus ventricosus]